jgi:hypothetical protein
VGDSRHLNFKLAAKLIISLQTAKKKSAKSPASQAEDLAE